MNQAMIDTIVQAVLYEGYILYPYRPSTKNHQRWTFGGVFPREYSNAVGGAEPCEVQTQCLIRGGPQTRIAINVRFLRLIDRRICTSSHHFVQEIEIEGKRYQSWQEASEQGMKLELSLGDQDARTPFSFPADQSTEPLRNGNGRVAASFVRTQKAVSGIVEAAAEHKREDIYQLTVRVSNLTPLDREIGSMSREQALLHSMASTHIVLSASNGEFISLIDPPADLKVLSRQCSNLRVWPVLVGEPGETDCMLASPIILYDYPRIAPQSPGDLFDGTEIDEILSLRILTLTDEEKRQAAALDEHGAALLRRTETLAREQLMRLHGTMRPPQRVEAVHVGQAELHIGDHVRLRPRRGADAFDLILRGKLATIISIEQDYENRLHVAVTVDDDPGADIGAAGKIGHRFYFGLDEIEPATAAQEANHS